jgi:hypothetical protein
MSPLGRPLRAPVKMISPFALQFIFLARSIPCHSARQLPSDDRASIQNPLAFSAVMPRQPVLLILLPGYLFNLLFHQFLHIP